MDENEQQKAVNDQLAFDFGVAWSTSMQKLLLLVSLSEWCNIAAKTVKEPFLQHSHEVLRGAMPNSDDELLKQISEMAAQTEHVSALYLADAAIVVFAHSVLDQLINITLEFSIKLDISLWREHILHWSKDKKKYSLSDLSHGDFIAQLREESVSYCNHLKSRSLPNRVEVLLGILKPSAQLRSDHQFDLETLKRLDKLRHTLIHDELFGQTLSVDGRLLTALQLTGYFIHRLLVEQHGLNVNAVSEGMVSHSQKINPGN